jgi:hypothetical protein
MSSIENVARRAWDAAPSPTLRLVTAPPGRRESSWAADDDATIELRLRFRELVLIHKSLRAVKALGALPPQDELLNDTTELVDLALKEAL